MRKWSKAEKTFTVQEEILLIDTGDITLKELCSDEDHPDAEIEMDYYSHPKNIFTSGKKNSSGSCGITSVNPTIHIGDEKGRKGKKR